MKYAGRPPNSTTAMNKTLIRLTQLLAVVILLALSTTIAYPQQLPTFRIGIVAGENSTLARGAVLIMDQINATGGIVGADGSRFQLQPVYAPLDSETAVQESINNLAANNVIAIIGPETTAEVNQTLPLLAALNVPILTTATESSLLLSDTTGRLLRLRAPDFLTERALADYLINERGISQIEIVQFDIEATVNVLSFSNAAQSLGLNVANPTFVNRFERIASTADELMRRNPQAIVTYGNPVLGGDLYVALQNAGYTGLYTHPRAATREFRGEVPGGNLSGIIGASTWSYGATDQMSDTFLADYVRAYGAIPDAIAAAAADGVKVLETAIGRPGVLLDNLIAIEGNIGIQGILVTADLAERELSNNVLVFQLNDAGAPVVLSRFAGTTRIPLGEPESLVVTPTPTPTATPDGVVVTIISAVQNVRTGPSTDYEVIGQVREGDQFPVIGANSRNTWVVIDFRGQQGWLANLSNLNEVFGDLNTVPLVIPPPTPTPVATSTPTPPQEPDLLVDAASISPNPIIPGAQFTVTVTIRNAGRSTAGRFAVASTMPPNDVFVSGFVDSLAPGATTNLQMTGTMQNTGTYSSIIVVDLNNQVAEGPGEANNNSFSLNYRIDRPTAATGTSTLSAGGSLNVGGVQVAWDGSSLDVVGGDIGLLGGTTFDGAHYDLVNNNTVNLDQLQPAAGQVLGARTDNNTRGVMLVESVGNGQVTLRYRIYTP